MFDFTNHEVKETELATVDITLELGSMRPVLTCKPATEDNVRYFNALSRKTRARLQRRGDVGGKNLLDEKRIEDAELYVAHCVVGWKEETVIDEEGCPAPFTKENCLKFFLALIEDKRGRHVFENFGNRIGNIETFFEIVTDDPVAVKAQAGN